MKSIEELKKRHASELAKLEREIADAGLLPANPKPAHVIAHEGFTGATYEFPTLREAVKFAESFEGLIPALEFAGTYGHFKPEVLFDRDAKRDFESPKRQPMECVAELRLQSFRLSNDDPLQSSAELSFYAKRGERVFDITCRIGSGYARPPYYLTMRPTMNGNTRRSNVALWNAPDAVRANHSRTTRYATGSGAEKGVDARFYYCEFESLNLLCDELGE